jgi:hypothetical protein
MTPLASAAHWQPAANRSRPVRVLKIGAAAAVALLAGAYLASYVFLWSLGLDAHGATPLTLVRYGYYYADRPVLRRHLLFSSAAGGALA